MMFLWKVLWNTYQKENCLAKNKFDHATKQLYKAGPNGRGGMIRPPMDLVGIRMKAAMKEADIDTGKLCSLDSPDLPPGTHAFDPESEFQDEQGNHDEVYTNGSKINE